MRQIIDYFVEEFIKNLIELRMDFYKEPEKLAEFVVATKKETDELARRTVQAVIQEMNDLIKEMPSRKRHWVVEHKGDDKKLVTSVGDIVFKKTLYVSKDEFDEEGKALSCYLLDKVLGLAPNQTMTEDAVANILKEAVQTSYRKGGEAVSPEGVTKGTVKDCIHRLKFPKGFNIPTVKKTPEYLYIEADEDHFNLQFQEAKGDLKISESGRKLNSAITRLIYVHEGIEPEAPRSRRNRLVNPHYFCRGDGQDNQALWKEVYAYIEAVYDLGKVKRIYLSSDGGPWIKAGYKGLSDITFVLDEFHLSKYIGKLTSHMKDSEEDAREDVYECIRKNTKKDFYEIVERLKGCTDSESLHTMIDDAAAYIASNWTAAKRRLKRTSGIVGSSTEGHVYHVLSSRMSTKPMGWSRHGGAQMARLLEYAWNRGDMFELAKYQKEELPLAAGAEEVVMSANAMLKSERTKRTRIQTEYAKYAEAITHPITLQTSKQLMFYLNGKL